MGAAFLPLPREDPMRVMGVGLFFATCGIFGQSLTEWTYRQAPILFTFYILLGALASLTAERVLRKKERRAAAWDEATALPVNARTDALVAERWGGTETAIERLTAGFAGQGVESVVYAPRLAEAATVADPLVAAGCVVRRFRAFVPVWGIPAEQKWQMVAV
eukprot:gene16526-21104_t